MKCLCTLPSAPRFVPPIAPVAANELKGVYCVSAANCWAVGYYEVGGSEQALTMHWNGVAWTIVDSPHATTRMNLLNGVSCSSSSDCWAVGYYEEDHQPFAF